MTFGDITDFLFENASKLSIDYQAVIGELDGAVSVNHLAKFVLESKSEKGELI